MFIQKKLALPNKCHAHLFIINKKNRQVDLNLNINYNNDRMWQHTQKNTYKKLASKAKAIKINSKSRVKKKLSCGSSTVF